MMRGNYTRELDEVSLRIQKMGKEIAAAVEKTRAALEQVDAKAARELIEGDEVFDQMNLEIEQECLNMVVLQAPVAGDWRRLASIMRMVADLERIADHCSDIAEYIIKLSQGDQVKLPVNFDNMFRLVIKMLDATVKAFIDLDTEAALKAAGKDDIQDDYFETTVEELVSLMKEDPAHIAQYVDYLMIAKYLERMSDHTTNLAEWIAYIAKGELTNVQ
ncbi:MAG TPA: phosphate signaling complex protein PhoU [Candidatus Pullilachnospira intestinigallinarum]|nr:phosphate signaling complex protein PhoU [Candidatus Pullilachnospira intestinigallinarum]